MKITDIKVFPVKENKSTKATVSFTVENKIVFTNFRLMDGSNGLWLGNPSMKKGEKWQDIIYITDKEFRQELLNKVIEKYNEVANNITSTSTTVKENSNDTSIVDIPDDELPF